MGESKGYVSSFKRWERMTKCVEYMCDEVLSGCSSMREREEFVDSCWDTLRRYPMIYRRVLLRKEDKYSVEVMKLITYGIFKDAIRLEIYIGIMELCVAKLEAIGPEAGGPAGLPCLEQHPGIIFPPFPL